VAVNASRGLDEFVELLEALVLELCDYLDVVHTVVEDSSPCLHSMGRRCSIAKSHGVA
jgi:hypothetical protein